MSHQVKKKKNLSEKLPPWRIWRFLHTSQKCRGGGIVGQILSFAMGFTPAPMEELSWRKTALLIQPDRSFRFSRKCNFWVSVPFFFCQSSPSSWASFSGPPCYNSAQFLGGRGGFSPILISSSLSVSLPHHRDIIRNCAVSVDQIQDLHSPMSPIAETPATPAYSTGRQSVV